MDHNIQKLLQRLHKYGKIDIETRPGVRLMIHVNPVPHALKQSVKIEELNLTERSTAAIAASLTETGETNKPKTQN